MVEHFLRYRIAYEILFWLAYFGLNDWVGAVSLLTEYQRLGIVVHAWEPFVWEFTSGIGFLMLLPVLLAVDRRLPIYEARVGRAIGLHALASVPFSLAHVGLMVTLRKLVYRLNDRSYDFGAWPTELWYEYRKDALTYAWILIIVYAYRYILRRYRGEARLVAEGEAHTDCVTPERLLVKKRGREFIVRVSSIDWIEACGNYVNLHVSDRIYPLRSTMATMEKQLTGRHFVRVHRSYMVNLDRVSEIRPLETGDYRIILTNGVDVALSRRYRTHVIQSIPGLSSSQVE